MGGRNGLSAGLLRRLSIAPKTVCGIICGNGRQLFVSAINKWLILLVARDGIEPPTYGFSVRWPITESS